MWLIAAVLDSVVSIDSEFVQWNLVVFRVYSNSDIWFSLLVCVYLFIFNMTALSVRSSFLCNHKSHGFPSLLCQ